MKLFLITSVLLLLSSCGLSDENLPEESISQKTESIVSTLSGNEAQINTGVQNSGAIVESENPISLP